MSKKERQARMVRWAVGVFVAAVLLALLGYGVWYMMNGRETAPKAQKQVMRDLSVKSYELNEKGDYSGASQAYSDAAAQAASPEERQQILLQQASMALAQNKLDDALTAAKAAEEAKASLAASQMIAIIAEKKNDKEMAVSYLKRALGQLDTNSPVYESEKTTIQEKIVSLGGQL